jgi:hypothetical protein
MVSQIVLRCERGEEHGECDSDDHLVSGRSPMKQAGKLESKSMVLLTPNSIFVDRHRGEIVPVDFWVQHTSLDESIAPVISPRCLFETFKQLVVMFAGAGDRLVVRRLVRGEVKCQRLHKII